uniref:Reverse transcriptase domain-containing protein n=1 Tax=Strongyloides papillosus TaxID=174720 RepID=A0A0N5C5K0_STREA
MPSSLNWCNQNVSELSKDYVAQLEDPVWAQATISDSVYDNPPHFPSNMDKQVRGVAAQLLLYKAGLVVSDLNKVQQITPESIFSDYKYKNVCYTRLPVLVDGRLQFVDNDGYIHEYSVGHPCTQLSPEEVTEFQTTDEKTENQWSWTENFSLLSGLSTYGTSIWICVQNVVLGVLGIVLLILVALLGWKIWKAVQKCRANFRKRRIRQRQRKTILSSLSEVVVLSNLGNTQVSSIGPLQGKQLFVNLYIAQNTSTKIVKCLIDSGACVSFIRKDCLSEFKDIHTFAQPTKIAQDFNNNPILAIGQCKVKFVFNTKKIEIPLLIMEKLHQDVLLGSYALEYLDKANFPVTFKLSSNIIQIGNTRHPLDQISRVSYLSPSELWDTVKTWIWCVRSLDDTLIGPEPEAVVAEELDMPDKLINDLAIWDPLPHTEALIKANLADTQFSEKNQKLLTQILFRCKAAFIHNEEDIGRYSGPIKHEIMLKEKGKLPISGVPRHSPIMQEKAYKLIQGMLKSGIIQHSKSTCTSRYLIVPKPNGSDRFVVDYRQLNTCSYLEVPCIPHIEDLLNKVCQFRYLSVFDVASGFHQIHLDESSR